VVYLQNFVNLQNGLQNDIFYKNWSKVYNKCNISQGFCSISNGFRDELNLKNTIPVMPMLLKNAEDLRILA